MRRWSSVISFWPFWLALIVLIAAGGTISCEDSRLSGSSGLIPLTPTQVTATWAGTFVKTSQLTGTTFVEREGTVQFVLERDGRAMTGTAQFTKTTPDPDCWDLGDLSVFFETGLMAEGRLLTADTNGPALPSPDTVVIGDLTFTGDRLIGTYRATVIPSGSPIHCRLEEGSFEAIRQ